MTQGRGVRDVSTIWRCTLREHALIACCVEHPASPSGTPVAVEVGTRFMQPPPLKTTFQSSLTDAKARELSQIRGGHARVPIRNKRTSFSPDVRIALFSYERDNPVQRSEERVATERWPARSKMFRVPEVCPHFNYRRAPSPHTALFLAGAAHVPPAPDIFSCYLNY